MIMLDERLEKYANIGSRKSIAFVARWLLENTTSVESLKRFAKVTSGIDVADIVSVSLYGGAVGCLG